MYYPATIIKADDGYTVSFRDIPEALAGGTTLDESLADAQDALITAMEFYFEDNRTVPLPSKTNKDDHLIELPPSVASKVLLLNLMLEQHISNAELARRMKLKPQEIQRITNLSHSTKIDTIANAISCLGKSFTVGIT